MKDIIRFDQRLKSLPANILILIASIDELKGRWTAGVNLHPQILGRLKQSVLIKIRGNKAYDHIKKFAELGLINKKKMGHTAELTLAELFHDYFHTNKEEISNKENA